MAGAASKQKKPRTPKGKRQISLGVPSPSTALVLWDATGKRGRSQFMGKAAGKAPPKKSVRGMSRAGELALIDYAAKAEARADRAERKARNMADKKGKGKGKGSGKKRCPPGTRGQKVCAKGPARPAHTGKRRTKRSMLSPAASGFLLSLGGAILSGYLSGAKVQTQDGVKTLADAAPKIPFVGFEATVAVAFWLAGWLFKVKWLRKLAWGPGLIAGYKLFRGVSRSLEAGSLGVAEIPASMTSAGLPQAEESATL